MNDVAKLSDSDPIRYMQMRTVGVKFENNSKTYSYFVPEGDSPVIGDIAITSAWDPEQPESDDIEKWGGVVRFAKVVSVHLTANDKANKFYLMLAPMELLRNRREQSKELSAKFAERKELMGKLDTLLLQQSKLDHYRKLAETSPEAKELLDKLLG